jgi:ribonuclease P protein component
MKWYESVAKTNLRKQKSKSKLQVIFDEGVKFVSKSFIAFFLSSPSEVFHSTIIASKKVGNAVKRNRSKRRLREIVRLYIEPNSPQIKLILIARSETAIVDYAVLMRDCNNLIKKISQI